VQIQAVSITQERDSETAFSFFSGHPERAEKSSRSALGFFEEKSREKITVFCGFTVVLVQL
jgi:hypothetical protein